MNNGFHARLTYVIVGVFMSRFGSKCRQNISLLSKKPIQTKLKKFKSQFGLAKLCCIALPHVMVWAKSDWVG
jgi:hypothetical protein